MKVVLSPRPSPDVDAVAVGVWEGARPDDGFRALDQHQVLTRALRVSRFRGREGETLTLAAPGRGKAGRVVLLGLGPHGPIEPARAQRLGGALVGELLCSGAERLSVRIDLGPEAAAHMALGMRLKAWHPPHALRSRLDEAELPSLREATVAASAIEEARHHLDRLDALADAVALARDLVTEPGNHLTPENFARRALLMAAHGCTVEILDEERLRREGLGLLLAVGQGSAQAPRLAVVGWNGGAPGEPPLVFVGKGITFDTGGLSIKRDPNMWEMKGDMGGAAAALGAIRALAGRRAKVNAAAVLAIAENMPSGRALRPGDVVRAYDGRTVEVVDTDAEGRLVLADALAWACARLKPRTVIDLATLTGAVVTTLGRHRAGLFCNDDALAERVYRCGEASGEPVWRLPLQDAHDEALKSDIADLRNCAWGFVPDALHAARFLQHFVPESVAWAHLDIAGVAEAAEAHPLGPKGATGFGVRLLDELARG